MLDSMVTFDASGLGQPMAHQIHQAVDDLGPLMAGDGAQTCHVWVRGAVGMGAMMMGHQTQSSTHIHKFVLASTG